MNKTVIDSNALTSGDSPATLVADRKPQGYEVVRYNAMKHGILSRYTVLSHESHADYKSLVNSLMNEHLPAGATEQHLIEELASVIWRKRRVLQAEGASINRSLRSLVTTDLNTPMSAAAPFEEGLSGKGADMRRLMSLSPGRVAEDQENAQRELSAAWKAGSILHRNGANAYEKARRALLPESRDCWDQYVEARPLEADVPGFAAYIRGVLEPVLTSMEKQARYQPAIKAQTFGEGLQAHKLEQLNRYETHLDRKFERTLGMLLKLKEIRSGRAV
jgi:hypothetical protein